MKYRTFLKERMFMAGIFGWLLFSIETFLLTFRGSFWLVLYVAFVLNGGYFLLTYIEFRRRRHFLSEVTEIAGSMEESYLIGEMKLPVLTQEDRMWQELLQESGKKMKEHVNKYSRENKEYKEYIELWIHEVKLPIAAAKLMLENHRDQAPEGLEEELNRIEGYTEQALFYARSNDVEKDYFIREICLSDIVNEVLAANRRELIAKHCEVNLHDLQKKVYSDGKWLHFILNQILSNSIKYAMTPETDRDMPLFLEICAQEQAEGTVLLISDQGIGIPEEEISRVFEKGFTGSNGRKQKKSTGIGLYLCKKLCGRLGHSISVSSGKGKGCTVQITFPKSSYIEGARKEIKE